MIEIVSPSTASHDYVRKFELYKRTGVREYWIINPDDKSVVVHRFERNSTSTEEYTLDDLVKAGIYDDLTIDFKAIMKKIAGL